MTTSSPRRVRPGEIPQPLSVWSWREPGDHLLVLGYQLRRPASGGGRYHIIALRLETGQIDDAIWSSTAHIGMGPVLTHWWCHEEAPDVNII